LKIEHDAIKRFHLIASCSTSGVSGKFGEAPESQWHQEKAATQQAILERRIGFADACFVGAVDPHIARQRRDGDALRRRRNFDLHIRLQPPLMIWIARSAPSCPARSS